MSEALGRGDKDRYGDRETDPERRTELYTQT